MKHCSPAKLKSVKEELTPSFKTQKSTAKSNEFCIRGFRWFTKHFGIHCLKTSSISSCLEISISFDSHFLPIYCLSLSLSFSTFQHKPESPISFGLPIHNDRHLSSSSMPIPGILQLLLPIKLYISELVAGLQAWKCDGGETRYHLSFVDWLWICLKTLNRKNNFPFRKVQHFLERKCFFFLKEISFGVF